ncbi:helix-turn-helix domain-containing protein [Actinomycetospora sp. OC33-EN08]|uniref:Helix-turn-helix domain-containing protein n=1 Tax=Actinomycetospora aurantiaca TaxID=3129233 RepID=A0ABU8MY13_9PSEU
MTASLDDGTPRTGRVLTVLCRVLRADLDGLADELTHRILDSGDAYAAYAAHGVPVGEDLRATCRANLDRVLLVLGGDLPPETRAASLTVATARRRAQQGVPLEVVLQAYRLCGRLLWDHLRAASTEHFGGAYDHELLDVADDLWRTIDRSSARLVSAYRAEEARLRGRDAGRRWATVDGVLEGRARDPRFAAEAARTLGLPEHGPLAVVLAGPGTDEPLDDPSEALLEAGLVSVWHHRHSELVGLVALPDPGVVGPVVAALAPRAHAPTGVSEPVAGLAEVPVGLTQARIAARTVPAGRAAVVALDQRLPEALLAQSPELAERVRRAALGRLLDLPAGERRVLLATLEAVLSADGSPSRAAAALYCHRNTVMYRLARIRDLTGRVVTEPRDRLLLGLGVLWEPDT